MRVFVTGGGGMVGRNIVEHAKAKGHTVLAPSRRELDLFDYAAVRDTLAANSIDMVVHVAGRVGGIEANIREPVAFLTENLDLGRNVVLAAREVGVPQLLNLSSSCMYPKDVDGSLTEDMIMTGPLEPTNEGYAIAKIATMRLCSYVSREQSQLAYKTAIPCNLYGRYDRFDPVRAHLVPSVIAKVHAAKVSGASSVEIWGDGLARREFMLAADLADFVWAAIEDFERVPELLNVGLGYDYSVNEYYEAVARVVGWSGKFTHDLSRPTGMRRKLVDVSRQQAFGWKPSFTLEQGLAETYAFYRALISDSADAAPLGNQSDLQIQSAG